MARSLSKKPTYKRQGRYARGVYAYALREDRDNININVPADLVDKVIALSWLWGGVGAISASVRPILIKAVNREIAELDPKEREEFESIILPNVKTERDIKRRERRERMRDINASLRSESETEFIPDQDEEEEEP